MDPIITVSLEEPQIEELPVPTLVDNDAIYAEYMGPLGTARQALRNEVKPVEHGIVGEHSIKARIGADHFAVLVAHCVMKPIDHMPGWFAFNL